VTASGGTPGLLTREALPLGGTVQYTFFASNPGTYTYYSGTNPDLQVEMGLVGAIIVRPTLGSSYAYNHADTFFNREFLFLLSEIDIDIHDLVATGQMAAVDTTTFFPVYWFINGRSAPDTMAPAMASWLPSQPYDCMPRMHPGEKVLLRFIGAGRDAHPLHTHGNHHRVIARDARLLESTPGAGPDLGELAFTTTVVPGSTADGIFTWTGEKLGWDIYGHQPGDPPVPGEYLPDHGKPLPVALPDQKDLTFGMFFGGTAFLGVPGSLPPGQVTMNTTGALSFMWHSHNEKEITTNNLFPGGMLTMSFIEHPTVIIEPNNP
jgi:FtsP/CotA-like multicopper oxidase with cupredoxin domain